MTERVPALPDGDADLLEGPGRDYYLRKRDAGRTPIEAMRCLKRRLSDVVFRALLDDLEATEQPQDEEGLGALPPSRQQRRASAKLSHLDTQESSPSLQP